MLIGLPNMDYLLVLCRRSCKQLSISKLDCGQSNVSLQHDSYCAQRNESQAVYPQATDTIGILRILLQPFHCKLVCQN